MKNLQLLFLLFFSLRASSQIDAYGLWGNEPSDIPDTLYFPFEDGVQLVAITYYDVWLRKVSFYEMSQPRGASWAQIFGPSWPNAYVIRDTSGTIVKTYNTNLDFSKLLKPVDSTINTIILLPTLNDCQQFNNHLMVYTAPFLGELEMYSNSGILGSKVGLINLKGEVVVDTIYDGIRPFQQRDGGSPKYIVTNDGFFGFLDENFKVLFEPIYKSYPSRENKLVNIPEHEIEVGDKLKVFKDDKCGLISQTGEVLIDFKYDAIYPGHDSVLFAVTLIPNPDKGRYFWLSVESIEVYDKNFNVISKLEGYDQFENFGINSFRVKKDNKYGLVNMYDKVIVPIKYDGVDYAQGAIGVIKRGGSGLLSYEGDTLVPLIYDSYQIYGDAIYVTLNGLIGVYSSKTYKEIVAPRYKHKHWDYGKWMLTDAEDKVGYVKHEKEGTFYMSPEGKKVFFD